MGGQYRVTMTDSMGDGWSGNELRVLDCDGGLIADGLTVPNGESSAEALVCTGSAGSNIAVECGGGIWKSEVMPNDFSG